MEVFNAVLTSSTDGRLYPRRASSTGARGSRLDKCFSSMKVLSQLKKDYFYIISERPVGCGTSLVYIASQFCALM